MTAATATTPATPTQPPGTLHVADLPGLAALYRPDLTLVVWDRTPDPQLAAFAANVLARTPLQQEREVEAAELDTFQPLPPPHTDDPVARAFAADVRHLARAFADLTAASRLGIRLVRLTDAMCPRFHTDVVGVRLLTTYHGAGTEWLAEPDVDRRFLGHRANGRADADSGLLRPGAVVHRLPAFAVALCKGEAWPGSEGRGFVHRSPASPTPRVLLSIDVLAQDDTDDDDDAPEPVTFEPVRLPPLRLGAPLGTRRGGRR
jgi:hypothetical protein